MEKYVVYYDTNKNISVLTKKEITYNEFGKPVSDLGIHNEDCIFNTFDEAKSYLKGSNYVFLEENNKEKETEAIRINFKEIFSEIKEKDVKIILGIGNTMCIEDNKSNLYEIETYYHGSYLEKMIKNGYVVTFNKLEKKQSEHLKTLYENKVEIFDYNKMKDFYKNVVLVEYPELEKANLNMDNKIEDHEKNRIFDTYKKRLLKECTIDNGNKINFLSIEYLCEFPKINPIEMAKSLISSGCEIVFDDTSISQAENNKKRNQVYSYYYDIDKIENKDEDSEEDCL